MEMAPGTVITDADVAHLTLQPVVAFDRHSERLCALCGGDNAAIAIGLLDEVVMLLDIAKTIAIELLIPLHRTEISGGEKSFQC